MKLNRKRMVWIIVGVAAQALVVQLSVVVGIEYDQLKKNEKRLATFQLSERKSKTLVVYFSRSGNTELMAYQIAQLKHTITKSATEGGSGLCWTPGKRNQ